MSQLRKKREYPDNFKTIFGVTGMSLIDAVGASFMTTWFMLYLTDYAGIGALGAVLGTVLLLIGRIVDAVDDPIQGWIMDNYKGGKYGKYKPFIILSIILTAVSICCLYSLPTGIASNPTLVVIWVLIFYLMYDIGASFFASAPLIQSLSNDDHVRSKFLIWPRVATTFVTIPVSFLVSIATGINENVGDMHTSFSLVTLGFVIPLFVVSMIGIACVKEGKHCVSTATKEDEKVKVKDIILMLRTNKALTVNLVANVFFGFVWTLLFATVMYYIKWAYCVDLITGAVDNDLFGLLSMIVGMLMIMPLMITTLVSPILLKKVFKTPIKMILFSLAMVIVPGILLFVLDLVGVVAVSPAVYLLAVCIMTFGIGFGFVPQNLITLECIDYNFFKTGKEMGGLVNALTKFLQKAQTALSSALVGAILIAVGYVVDSVTGEYIGELSNIPTMLHWFIVVSGLVPALLAAAAYVSYKFYPITPEIRAQMDATKEKAKAE